MYGFKVLLLIFVYLLDTVINNSNIYRNDVKTATISYQTSKSVVNHNSKNNMSGVASTTEAIESNRMLKYNLKYLKRGNLLQKIAQPKYILSSEGGKTKTVFVDRS